MTHATEVREWLFLAVACISVVVAAISIIVASASARRIARQRATLDFIDNYNDDPRVIFALHLIREYQNESPADYLAGDNRDNFLFLLNKFEILAVGLKHQIYDHSMTMDLVGDEMRLIYEKSEPLIRFIRAELGGGFEELEAFAAKAGFAQK